MCLGVLLACMPVHCVHVSYMQSPEENARFSRTEVTVGCEPLCRC